MKDGNGGSDSGRIRGRVSEGDERGRSERTSKVGVKTGQEREKGRKVGEMKKKRITPTGKFPVYKVENIRKKRRQRKKKDEVRMKETKRNKRYKKDIDIDKHQHREAGKTFQNHLIKNERKKKKKRRKEKRRKETSRSRRKELRLCKGGN